MKIRKMHINKSIPHDTVIFRYMDILKFLDLLVAKRLYFSNYKYFSDKYETDITKNYLIRFKTSSDANQNEETLKDISEFFMNQYVNCWNISNSVQYLLWKSYCQNIKYGVVIKSTIKRLKDSLESENDLIFECDKVKYIPFPSNPQDIVNPVFTKYDFYSSEEEIRVSCIVKHTDYNDKGTYIPVDVNMLIEEVIYSFNSPFFQTLSNVILNIMGEDFLTHRLSTLDMDDDSLKSN